MLNRIANVLNIFEDAPLVFESIKYTSCINGELFLFVDNLHAKKRIDETFASDILFLVRQTNPTIQSIKTIKLTIQDNSLTKS